MEFRILGPLEVESEGGIVSVRRRKQRAVLEVLLLHANRPVSAGVLIDAIWGDRAPETALTTLQGYVSALRKTFGAELIVTRGHAYVLQTEPASIDLARFETLVDAGTEALGAGDATTASERLNAALSLWRGEPLEDLDCVAVVESERSRLEEMRLRALEDRIEADLALGRHAEVVPDLQALVREEPLRERLRGQLMLALYRSGRQAEALDVYRQGRHMLAEQLGLEPGEPLKRLERRILDHDPTLSLVAPPRSRPAEAPDRGPVARDELDEAAIPRHRSTWWRRRRVLAAVAACVVALAAAGLGVALTGGGPGTVAVVPNSIAVIDTDTNLVVGDVRVGRFPVAVASGEGGIWVCLDGGTVAHIDAATRKLVQKIDVGSDCNDVAVGFGSVWVAGGTDSSLVRIDPDLGRPEAVPLRTTGDPESGFPLLWVATGAGSVWATRGSSLLQIDPADNRLVQTIDTRFGPSGLAAGRSFVSVVTEPHENLLLRFDALGRRSSEGHLPGHSVSPVASYDPSAPYDLWLVVYQGVGEVRRYGSGGATGRISIDQYPLAVALGAGAAWVVNLEGTVWRLDPGLTTVEKRIATAPTSRSSLAVGYGAVWVAIQHRI
jgi:DNA-binding SARP family transcriptional activator